jgi:hypothetical protein
MPAVIFDLIRKLGLALLFASSVLIVSCASDKSEARLVDDPDDRGASTIPWNKQEKWEVGGQFAGMTDRR